ncbi:MAG: hypothetical protein ACLFWF_12875, partial [Alphaproteobacteria bacterium]
MPNRPEMQRAEAPETEAPEPSRESEFGAAPKAVTTPMRARREETPARNGRDGGEAAKDTAKPKHGREERKESRERAPAPDAATEGTKGKAPEDGPAGSSEAGADLSRPAPPRTSRPGKTAKHGRGQKTSRKPMIQRVDPPDFPDFPDPAEMNADKPAGREDSPQMVRAIAVGMPILGLIG